MREVSKLHIGTLYGTLTTPDWPDDLIVKSLQLHGEWAESETDLLASIVDESDRFWDLGAFLGTFALSLAKKVRVDTLVVVEANPELSDVLRHNLTCNAPCRVCVAPYGVAQHAGWLRPCSADAMVENHGATAWTWSAEHTDQAVQCRTLSDLRGQLGDYDVIKLDLEGMERSALLGDFAFLRDAQPVIWAECNEDRSSLELLKLFKWLDYEIRYVAFPAFRSANYRGATDLIYPGAYEAALVAAPSDRLARLDDAASSSEFFCRRIATNLELRQALFDTPRWCTPELYGLNKPQLIARLTRHLSKSDFKDFLA